jgi:hypothetical protein
VYVFFLTLHSVMRWVVLGLAVVSVVLAIRGWIGDRPFTRGQNRTAFALLIGTDFQLLFGLMLYFVLSPYSRVLFNDFAYAMGSREFRFWGLEHTLLMLIGVVLVHVGFALAKRSTESLKKHRRAAVCFGLALVAFLAGTPWPFLETIGRPWLRLFS